MHKHELLAALHRRFRPRTYFEIGVRLGRSLELSRVPSIGVDPFFMVESELRCDLHLVRATSDEFFARPHPFAHFEQPVFDLAFIDGMHLAEFALRDFINTERFSHPGSVVVIDDVLPRNDYEASREFHTGAWTGDVFKMIDVMRAERPDLVILEVDTTPTGTLVVLLPDAGNRALHRAYDAAVADFVVPDPQTVPAWATERTRTISPEALLDAPIWDELVRARRRRPEVAARELRSLFDRAGLTTSKVTT